MLKNIKPKVSERTFSLATEYFPHITKESLLRAMRSVKNEIDISVESFLNGIYTD